MPPCATCGDPLRIDRDRLGARCPTCREPLYEQARDPHQTASVEAGIAGSHCANHPRNAAVGTCQRCGNYLCSVCWTRWHHQSVCLACLNRALEAQETTPIEARAHLRQALLGIVFGIIAWIITLGAFLLMAIGMAGEINVILLGFGIIILLGSPVPSVIGIGQAAAAIRARGDHMIMATMGLLLSGLHAGMVIGLFTFMAWDS